MSIKRLSGAGLTTPKSNKLWDQVTFQSGMFAIATVSLTSSASSIDFNNIPQNYTHLQLRSISATVQGNNRGNSQYFAQFNGDTGQNYPWHQLKGNGSAASATGSAASGNVAITGSDTLYAGGVAGVYNATIMDILDYSNTTKYKTVIILNGFDSNSATTGNTSVGLNSGLWLNTNAITRITIPSTGFNLKQYSHFALYGIKVA